MVFMFFEDVNMLLPVETEYDEANNTVSATTDRVGTYCLMDMEMLFKNLGIEPDGSQTPQISTQALDKAQIMPYNGNELVNQGMYSNGKTNSKGGKDHFDVVFMIDEINYTDEELSAICEKIYNVSKAVFNASANVTVRVYGLNGKNKQTGCDFYGRTDNVNGLESILKKVSHTELSADDLIDIARATSISEAIDYVALSYIISNINDKQFENNFNFEMTFSEAVKKASELGIAFDHEEFGFIFFNADRTNCNINGFETLFSIGSNSYNIKQSIVSNVAGIENKDEYKYSYARVLFDETEGMNFDIAANREVFVEDVIKYIYGKVPTEAGAYDAIIATGYHTIVLDKPLTEHDMELAEKRFDDPDYVFSEEELAKCADTDRDGLFDFEEVMFFTEISGKYQLITFKNNEIQLPKVYKILNELDEVSYVQSGSLKAQAQYKDFYDEFLSFSVLPIISDPTSVDGDGDGILDIDDKMPLIYLTEDERLIYEFLVNADAFEVEFYLKPQVVNLIPNNVKRITYVEICRKHMWTSNPKKFCQELFDKEVINKIPLFPKDSPWVVWLSEYELMSEGKSFEQMTEYAYQEWCNTNKLFITILAFDCVDELCRQMAKWDYTPEYKLSLEQEKTLSNTKRIRPGTLSEKQKVQDIKDKYNAGKKRNGAYSYGSIGGEEINLECISGKNGGANFTKVDSSLYNYTGINGNDYMYHTEQDIMEYLYNVYKNNKNVTGSITIISEREICANCSSIISQFEQDFPYIYIVRVLL